MNPDPEGKFLAALQLVVQLAKMLEDNEERYEAGLDDEETLSQLIKEARDIVRPAQ